MNKKILVGGVFVLLVMTSFAIADVVSRLNQDVDIPKEAKTTLTAKGITAPETTALTCENYKCEFKMYQILPNEEIYNLGTHTLDERTCESWNECAEDDYECIPDCLSYHTYTTEELTAMKKELIEKWMEGYAGVLDSRDAKTKTDKLGGGTITINEKK